AHEVYLVYDHSSHSKQQELVELLSQVASTSKKIKLTTSGQASEAPSFKILSHEGKSAVSFIGIPAGHEFSSLILAILNTDFQGKLPDEAIVTRIKNIKGPIKLKTYISLSCENCPEVVQALNLMSVFHENMEHQMIDGEFAQDDI